MYLDKKQTLEVLRNIFYSSKVNSYIIITEPGQIKEDNGVIKYFNSLKDSIQIKALTYIHNYSRLMQDVGYKIIEYEYSSPCFIA